MSVATERYGFRRASQRIGLPIAMAIGRTSIPGDGPGWKMSPGALHRSTTDAGPMPGTAGAGFRDRSPYGRYTRPLWWPLSAESEFQLAVVQAWAGSRWLPAKFMCPIIGAAAITSNGST